jgi:tetratricopeptide (TPR) repeat protein
MKKFLLYVFLMGWVLALAPLVCRAEPQVPEAGLKAEMAQRWDDAIAVYRKILAKEPGRTDLWLRLADIQARLGRRQDVVDSLLGAVKSSPRNPELYFRLSQADAVNNQPAKALADINWALRFDPDNVKYLRARAKLADWAGNTELASKSYEELQRLEPGNPDVMLGRARNLSWSGALDHSAGLYREYLKKHPENSEAWLEYSRVQLWRGNYQAALNALGEYRARFGATMDYRKQKARILAGAGRSSKAMKLNAPLLKTSPDDFELNATRTLALHAGRRPAEALGCLVILERLTPGSQETAGIEKFVKTPLRSNLNLDTNFYDDSDNVRIFRSELTGEWVVSPVTRLSAGTLYEELRADAGSGLERRDGGERIRDNNVWAGIRHRFSPGVAADGRAGMIFVEGGSQFPLYRLGLDLQPLDTLSFRLTYNRDLYDVSPRAVSVGVRRGATRLQCQWQPNLLYTLDITGEYDTFSDNNRRWEATVAPRRAVLRTEKFNLDLGLLGWWFGFDKDLDNGYYDPSNYQRYAVTGYGYWKINENNGLSLFAAVGVQKDETMSSFQDGEDVSAEGIFGIYSDWMLKARVGYTNRRLASGAYDGFSGGLTLTRRF